MGVKTLISFMISFLPHERPSAAEVLDFIGKIREENGYDVTDDDFMKEPSWRIKQNEPHTKPTIDLTDKIMLENHFKEEK